MIQYLYFHTGREYVSKMSLNRSDEGYSDCEKLFNAMRQATEGNTFTYAPVSNGDVFFMQGAKGVNGQFVKGLRGNKDCLTVAPAKFVDKFEKSVSPAIQNAETLPEGDLPPLGRLQDDFSMASHLHHVFPKLLDILLFGDASKKIVIFTENPQKAANYIKVMSMLLPPSFMKKIGFCMGAASVMDEDVSVMKNDGSTESLSIRMWLPDSASMRFDSFASYCYVFDTRSNTLRDNYDKELSITAKALEQVNLCNQSQVTKFYDYVAAAFDYEGKFDTAKLQRNATLCLFELKPDVNYAHEILSLGINGDDAQQRAFVSAAQTLLTPQNYQRLSAQDRKTIVAAYTDNPSFARIIENQLYGYFSVSYATLDATEKKLFAEMISQDLSGAKLRDFVEKASLGKADDKVAAFDFVIKTLDVVLSRNGNDIRAIPDLIQTAIDLFDIEKTNDMQPCGKSTLGEKFFERIAEHDNAELRPLLAAVLLASAYKQSTLEELCDVRLAGLPKLLARLDGGHLAQVDFILTVRYFILEIADLTPQFGIDNQLDFLFSTRFGRSIAVKAINASTIAELLQADRLVFVRAQQRLIYESMSTAIRNRLLDEKFIKANVVSGTETAQQYISFFNSLPDNKKADAVEISYYIDSMLRMTDITKRLAEYRYKFTQDCYNTFSPANQKLITEKVDKLKKSDHSKSEELHFVEQTIGVFGENERVVRKGVMTYCGVFLWAFVLSLVSFLILSIPAIIIPASLGSFDWATILTKFTYYFKSYMFAVPVYVFLLQVVCYFAFSQGKRHKRLHRATVITALCGLLPTLVFVLAYLVFYYVRFYLPFAM